MKEFLEIGSVGEFFRLAEDKNLILRIDPYLMIIHYGFIFYINMNKLTPELRMELLNRLKHKIIYVKRVRSVKNIIEFLEEEPF